MANLMKMMKQAQAMQRNMEKLQEELAQRTVEFSAGGGMVTVVARGDISVQRITIDPKAVDPQDVEMLEDLVLAGVDGALKMAREMVSTEMAKLTEGMNLPGLPF